jgi:hypothetical protein
MHRHPRPLQHRPRRPVRLRDRHHPHIPARRQRRHMRSPHAPAAGKPQPEHRHYGATLMPWMRISPSGTAAKPDTRDDSANSQVVLYSGIIGLSAE